MFVRFRQTKTRLQASLIETRRVDGKVRHEHIAMLGTVDLPPSVSKRILVWQRLHERLERLSNRVDAATQTKVFDAVHARIPMVTPEEQRSLQLDNAKAETQNWDALAGLQAGVVEGQQDLIAAAERARTDAATAQAKAAENAAQAADRVARIERGEALDGGLSQPVPMERILRDAFSEADLARYRQLYEVSQVFDLDALKIELREVRERAERAHLRKLHRFIGR